MILVSRQTGKQLSTPRKVTKVFLSDDLKMESIRKNDMQKKKELLGHENTFKYWPRTVSSIHHKKAY